MNVKNRIVRYAHANPGQQRKVALGLFYKVSALTRPFGKAKDSGQAVVAAMGVTPAKRKVIMSSLKSSLKSLESKGVVNNVQSRGIFQVVEQAFKSGWIASTTPDTPEQAAVWYAWDTLLGVEKIQRRDAAVARAWVYLDSIIMEWDELYGTIFDKAAGSAWKTIRSIDKQSRSWRSAYNLWREGKITVDGSRMSRDMVKTLSKLHKVQKVFSKLSGIKREFPEIWKGLGKEPSAAASAVLRAVHALEAAISFVRAL